MSQIEMKPTEEIERLRGLIKRADELQTEIGELTKANFFNDLAGELRSRVFDIGKQKALAAAEFELSSMFPRSAVKGASE
jgi:hypothetical protein